MINPAGYEVGPAGVEAMLYGCPGVKEACVIATRDARRGEAVKAALVPKPGAELCADDVITWARDNTAAYKVPRLVELARELAGSGQTLWRELHEREDRGA